MVTVPKILLRPGIPEDAKKYEEASLCVDIRKWLGWERITPTQHKKLLKFTQDERERGKCFHFIIADATSNELLGGVGLNRRVQHPEEWVLFYWLHPEHRGQGVAHEACKQAIEYGFENLQAARIVAFHDKGNTRSEVLLQKLEFESKDDDGLHTVKKILESPTASWQKPQVT